MVFAKKLAGNVSGWSGKIGSNWSLTGDYEQKKETEVTRLPFSFCYAWMKATLWRFFDEAEGVLGRTAKCSHTAP